MSFLTNTKKQKKFITKNSKNTLEEKTDVILSPEFYWTKRLTLNINFSYEIKKMAPSIFDGFLPAGKFDYKVFKLAPHEFIIIAYDLETIKNELSSLGIDLLLVDKIYALQSEFLNDEISLKVDHEFGVASHNGIIVYTPLKFLETDGSLDEVLAHKKLSSDYLYFHRFEKINIAPQDLNLMMMIFILLNAIVITDTIKLEKDTRDRENQKVAFMKTNHLPSTSFQIKSTQDELLRIEKSQNDLRESLLYIKQFKLTDTESFEALKFIHHTLTYSAKFDTKKREEEFKKFLDKKEKSSIVIEAKL